MGALLSQNYGRQHHKKSERGLPLSSLPAEGDNGVPEAHSHFSARPNQHHLWEIHPVHANKTSALRLEEMS